MDFSVSGKPVFPNVQNTRPQNGAPLDKVQLHQLSTASYAAPQIAHLASGLCQAQPGLTFSQSTALAKMATHSLNQQPAVAPTEAPRLSNRLY